MKAILSLLKFILIGLLFAVIGEYYFSIMIRHDPDNFIGSIFFDSFYLCSVFLLSRLLLRYFTNRFIALLLYYFITGFGGLMVEWFLIGNSPWQNPAASQIGMFTYWTSATMMPLIFTDPNQNLASLRRLIVICFVVYALTGLLTGYLLPEGELRFAFLIWWVVIGYTLMSVFYLPYARIIWEQQRSL